MKISHTLKHLYDGKSLARIMMNDALTKESIEGTVLDVGGGRKPDYFGYFKRQGEIEIVPVDASISGINFETDALPFTDAFADTVVLCNTLEHVYNYQFLLKECRRVLKKEKQLVGFVPFFVGVHPDPRDYFRYTKDALCRILTETGFDDVRVTPVGGGLFTTNFNTVCLSLPRVLRPVLYLWALLWDSIFLTLRPKARGRVPLGYVFIGHA